MPTLSTLFGSLSLKRHSSSCRTRMRAICYDAVGGPKVLKVKEVKEPVLEDHQVMIKVAATAVNKRDLWRRQGTYEPEHVHPYLGLECSGVIVKVGRNVSHFKCGDEVCAILANGGGYAELVAIDSALVVSAPRGIPLVEAAALPCAGSIVWRSLFAMNAIFRGQTILIHGAAGGVGSLAIQMAKHSNCKVFITAGNEEKARFCQALGADVCINYKKEDFSKRVLAETTRGVDYILDCSGKKTFVKDLKCLAIGGTLIILGLCGCQPVKPIRMNFPRMAAKKLQVMGCDLRTLSRTDTAETLKSLKSEVWPAIEKSEIKPVICETFKFSEAAKAHLLMERKANMGKILLIP